MAFDGFLKIEGIEGESTDSKHKNEIEIESFSWGALQPSAQESSERTGKIHVSDFSFTTRVNKSSPVLMLSCASGKHIPKAVLTLRKAGEDQQEFIKVTFSDLLISSYQTGGSSGEAVPVDSFSLNFSKIEFQYVPRDPTGKPGEPVTTHFDVKGGGAR